MTKTNSVERPEIEESNEKSDGQKKKSSQERTAES